MKIKYNTSKGITLIALVITIIVLLILVAISLATLTGENGILTKTILAQEQAEIEDAKEQAKLDIAVWSTEKIQAGENTDLNDSLVKEILTDKDYVKGQPGNMSFKTKKNGYEIPYSNLYKKGKAKFTLTNDFTNYSASFEVEPSTTWEEFMSKNFSNNWDWIHGPLVDGNGVIVDGMEDCVLGLRYISTTAVPDYYGPLVDSTNKVIKTNMEIISRSISY